MPQLTHLYRLICEGECSDPAAKIRVEQVTERLIRRAWDYPREAKNMTLALGKMATTLHRMVSEQVAECSRCTQQRAYGNVIWLRPPQEHIQ